MATLHLNVADEDPDWDQVAPTLEELRLVNRTLPQRPFPRLVDLSLYGRAVDQVACLPNGLECLALQSTSVLDLAPLPSVARLDLTESKYCVTHGFGARRRPASGFLEACRGLTALGLGGTEVTDEALRSVLTTNPDLVWITLGKNRRLTNVDLSPLSRLQIVGLGDLRCRSVTLPASVKSLDLFRAKTQPPDLSAASELVELDLSYSGFADEVLQTLPRGVPLRRVQLDRAGLTKTGLAALAEAAPGIEELNLECAQIEDGDLSLLQAFPGLRKLSLRQTRVSDAGLRPLEHLPIDVLNLEYTNATPRGPVDNVVIAHLRENLFSRELR